ncbi:glycoside hydrolase family 127 protein [Cellulomonas sp. Sa3CUA2]|uniref:Glycoside hydrolase family 127 protein n=1 Tax=Cellulomonas avistercoris TaxID=2762242 RepID=A0ABR8QBD6_9CELL|nr:beta-L-arabinofuranosidase domain-containing protein [Cellulomonas avistercoris]MBD7917710.1 glycoside hydrolase family 127 protein [Cellulomonas avistercoris]
MPSSDTLRVDARSHGRPVAPSRSPWRPLGLDEVTLTGGFWGDLQQLNASTMITHVEGWLERLGWTGNFDAAVEGRLPLSRQGREFSDSEIYKLLEAMAWEVGRTGDADLDRRLRALAARVAAAQEPDGYIGTMFGRPGQRPRWSDLEWGHELYCIGHLIQAGVARARTFGDDEIVRVAVRAADHVCDVFGADGPQQGVCGHPEIEVALVELSRVTGERRYLDQARLFVERRGHGLLGEIDFGPAYFQDDVPVREATVLAGHAVRALYLAAAAVDLAVEDGDDELLGAVAGQVRTTLARRTYLTGGMGAHHEGESFGADFELPPDRSYSETCAGIASVMVNHRLLLQTGAALHADAVERALYNVVATSPAQDGKAFYYTNPLHQRTPGREVAADEVSPRAASSLRAPFFAVSCCPTNVTRTVASLAAYVASVDDSGVQLHQYAPATIRTELGGGRAVELEVSTAYPHDGRVVVRAVQAPADGWTLTLRVPSWAHGAQVTTGDGTTTDAAPGYVAVAGPAQGTHVVLDLPVAARWTWADPRVDAVRGQVAVERGPLVMALESVDLGTDVAHAVVTTQAPPVERDGQVLVPVARRPLPDVSWPFGPQRAASPAVTDLVPLVPYHAWAERGPSTMRVWLPVE